MRTTQLHFVSRLAIHVQLHYLAGHGVFLKKHVSMMLIRNRLAILVGSTRYKRKLQHMLLFTYQQPAKRDTSNRAINKSLLHYFAVTSQHFCRPSITIHWSVTARFTKVLLNLTKKRTKNKRKFDFPKKSNRLHNHIAQLENHCFIYFNFQILREKECWTV